jgi:hypothetical protein
MQSPHFFPSMKPSLFLYLRVSHLRVGLLMNFHARRLKDCRHRFIV